MFVRPSFALNRNTILLAALLAMLAIIVLMPQQALAAEGQGGGLPYESSGNSSHSGRCWHGRSHDGYQSGHSGRSPQC